MDRCGIGAAREPEDREPSLGLGGKAQFSLFSLVGSFPVDAPTCSGPFVNTNRATLWFEDRSGCTNMESSFRGWILSVLPVRQSAKKIPTCHIQPTEVPNSKFRHTIGAWTFRALNRNSCDSENKPFRWEPRKSSVRVKDQIHSSWGAA